MKKNLIFIVIAVIIVIIGAVTAFLVVNKNSNTSEEDTSNLQKMEYIEVSEEDGLSVNDWMYLLGNGFGYEDTNEYSEDKILGKDAVSAGFDQLGIAFEDYVLDGQDNTIENKARIAAELDVINEEYLDSYIGLEQAETLINNLKAIQAIEDYHVDVNEVQLADGIIDGSEWIADYYAVVDDKEEVIISTGDYTPKLDDRIVYKDLGGVLRGGTVLETREQESGKYDILLSPFTAQDNVIEDYLIAGYVDWSYLELLSSTSSDSANNITYQCNPRGLSSGSEYDFVSTEDGTTIKTDLHFKLQISKNVGEEKRKIRVEKASVGKYDITGYVDAAQKTLNKLKSSDDSFDAANSTSIDISLNDLSLYTYFKHNEAAEIELSCIPIVECEKGLSGDISIPLGKLPLAIGSLDVKVNITIEISSNLDVSLKFEPSEPISVGIHMGEHSQKQMANKPPLECNIVDFISGESLDLSMSAKISGGFGIELDVSLIGVPICDPKLKITLEVAAKNLNPVEGYDVACIEVRYAGPIVAIELTRDDDWSIIGELISINGWSSEFVLNDPDVSDLVNAEYKHIELLPDFNNLDDPLGNASVCTHYPKGEDHSGDPRIKFNPPETPEEVVWEDLEPEYKQWLADHGIDVYDCRFAYAHIDGDNQAELVLSFGSIGAGGLILSIVNGEVIDCGISYDDISYVPYSGYFKDSSGHMDHYYDNVYKLDSAGFNIVLHGTYSAPQGVYWDWDDLSNFEFKLDDQIVSMDEYNEAINKLLPEEERIWADTQYLNN